MDQMNQERLTSIKQLASLQFTPKEVAIMVAEPSDDITLLIHYMTEYTEENKAIYIAYNTGLLEEEVKIRQAIFLAAKQGSPPAQGSAMKLIVNTKLKNKGL